VAALVDDPASFRADALAGFVAAYERLVERVAGASAVMRRGGVPAGKVAVVGGGGSGHYPAFMGLVGPGMLGGAVVGEVFTSPSVEQVYLTGLAVEAGAGVLFSYGNYAGDCLNFDLASERLRSAGVDCRTVVVTDDVASAGVDSVSLRRGVAGDLVVYKVAGAAADRGYSLEQTEQVARRSNDRTRTIGVALGGCVLPGASEPLFTVADGVVEVGMGIHGEPGVSSVPRPPLPELAALMVDALLREAVGGTHRVAAVLNGLGATKYEELFGLWRHMTDQFERAGLELIAPEVGELVTSLDMAGCSLTLAWLDDELESLWLDGCDTPAFRRLGPTGGNPRQGHRGQPASVGRTPVSAPEAITPSVAASAKSRQAAGTAVKALAAMLHTVQEHESELGRLDAVAGDGDHGTGMVRGLTAALAAAEAAADAGLGGTLRAAGAAWSDRGGGTSGVLWGLLLDQVAGILGDQDQPVVGEVAGAVASGAAVVQARGGAHPGDKTLLDVLAPFAAELQRQADSGTDIVSAWSAAAVTARAAAHETATLSPRIGRARPLAERSVGHRDPGAVSMSLCIDAVTSVLKMHGGGEKHGAGELTAPTGRQPSVVREMSEPE
jgi:dihydroxyacetone kinase